VKEGGDIGRAVGPIGFEKEDVAIAEGLLDCGGIEDETLVDLAIDAPVGCKIGILCIATGTAATKQREDCDRMLD
jgi:hypothetical protein